MFPWNKIREEQEKLSRLEFEYGLLIDKLKTADARIRAYEDQNEQLLTDLVTAVQKIPRRDTKGRFRPKC